MTDSEQIRRAAVRAGLMGTHGTSVAMHKLEAFAELLLDEENEACADVAENWRSNGMPRTGVANEIRARRKA